ncbi:MAG: PorT family protein [Bacteroidales bacterium]|nr:PorT family protein [Bacteroidales bacterium]
MKKIITLAAVLFAAMISVNSFAQIRWSATAGFGQGTLSEKSGGVTVSDPDNGLFVGVLGEMPIQEVENLGIEAGLVYSWFTDKTDGVKENFHALNLPVKAKYCFPLNNEFGFFALAGPTLSLGLSATDKKDGQSLDLYDQNLKRFDIKLGIGAGVCFNDIIEFRLGYDWGLLNQSQNSNVTGHIHYLHIGLAYKF